jgi:alpha-tubulin suppressor-like RCC1 family protein
MNQILLFVFFAISLVGCGGGGGGNSTTPTTTVTASATTLKSISVTPATPSVAEGATIQLVATGTYGDGKQAAITKDITWSSSSDTYATVFTSGLVTGKSMGSAAITATSGGISTSVAINVTGPYVRAIGGLGHSTTLKADGTLWSWGKNNYGQLGDNSTVDRPTMVAISTDFKDWSNFAAGDFHTMAIRKDGSLWGWGFNQSGQIGNKTNVDQLVPVQIGTEKPWAAVKAGTGHTIALKKGTLWAWGRNDQSQLGLGVADDKNDGSGKDNTTQVKLVPNAPAAFADSLWSSIAAGSAFSVARNTSGAVYTWGANDKGQLGRGNTTTVAPAANVPTVVQVSGADFTALNIAAGGSHALAIGRDGAIYAWGLNSSGQLGTGNYTDATEPTRLEPNSSDNWSSIAAGRSHSLGIKSDGSLWAWGSNSDGQLGIGTTVSDSNVASDSNAPLQIGKDTDWAEVFAGAYHSFARKTNGTLWIWGRNQEGQLGTGDFGTLAKPITAPQRVQ